MHREESLLASSSRNLARFPDRAGVKADFDCAFGFLKYSTVVMSDQSFRSNRSPSIPLRHRQRSDPSSAGVSLREGQSRNVRIERPTHRPRSQSMFIPTPVNRASYASLPQSPAVSFLSMLAERDEAALFGDSENAAFVGLEEDDMVERYQIGRLLGHGAFSECRAAIHVDTGQHYALKIISTACPAIAHDFEREVQIWARLSHSSVLPLVDFFRCTEGLLVAVSPLIDPGSLLAFLSDNRLLPSEAMGIFRQLCLAVQYLHTEARIVHRDLKLENILISQQRQIFVCDFGLSLELDDSSIGEFLAEEEMKGSLFYLPPEDLRPLPATPTAEMRCKSDIWSLGIILYALLTGSLPFTDEYFPRLQQAILSAEYAPLSSCIDAHVHELIRMLLQADPADRPDIQQVVRHRSLNQ